LLGLQQNFQHRVTESILRQSANCYAPRIGVLNIIICNFFSARATNNIISYSFTNSTNRFYSKILRYGTFKYDAVKQFLPQNISEISRIAILSDNLKKKHVTSRNVNVQRMYVNHNLMRSREKPLSTRVKFRINSTAVVYRGVCEPRHRVEDSCRDYDLRIDDDSR